VTVHLIPICSQDLKVLDETKIDIFKVRNDPTPNVQAWWM